MMRKNSTLSVTASAKVTPELKRDVQAMAAKFQLDISDIVRHGVYRYVRYLQSLDGKPEEVKKERDAVIMAVFEMTQGGVYGANKIIRKQACNCYDDQRGISAAHP